MPDEIGTETTRSDVPSADESLFGDAADDAAAAVAEEHNANGETGKDPQGSDDAEGEAGASETDAPEDLKVVVSIKGGRATIGVQQPLVGPAHRVLRRPRPDRAGAGGPGGGRKAKARWEDEPKQPGPRQTRSPARRRPGVSRGRPRLRPPRARQRRRSNRR